MKKIFLYFVYLLLLISLFTVIDLSNVKRESNLILLSDNSIIEIGDHNYHKFYNMTKHSSAPDQKSGEIIKNWGFIGGINDIGTITTGQNSVISFYIKPKKGKVKCLIQNIEAKEIVFSDYILEEVKTLSLEEGLYRIFVVADEFSGKCNITYKNAIFDTS